MRNKEINFDELGSLWVDETEIRKPKTTIKIKPAKIYAWEPWNLNTKGNK